MERVRNAGFFGFGHSVAKQDLIVLDELGYVPASKAGSELLFDIISTAVRTSEHHRDDEPAISKTGPKCC